VCAARLSYSELWRYALNQGKGRHKNRSSTCPYWHQEKRNSKKKRADFWGGRKARRTKADELKHLRNRGDALARGERGQDHTTNKSTLDV